MDIMKKRISLILSIIMLALVIIPVIKVNATEACQVSMTVKMGTTTLTNGGRYNVQGGEKITVSASSSKADIERIGYAYGNDPTIDIYSNKITIDVPYKANGTVMNLYIEAIAENDDGSKNTITKTGWMKYTLVYPTDADVENKKLTAKYGSTTLKVDSITEVEIGDKITIQATPASEVDNIQYRWTVDTTATKVKNSNCTVVIPSSFVVGKVYKLAVNALYSDGLCVDGEKPTATKPQYYYFKLKENTPTPTTVPSTRSLTVSKDSKVLAKLSTTVVKAGDKIVVKATPANNVYYIQTRWSEDSSFENTHASECTFTIPSSVKAGKTYFLSVNALYNDGLCADGRDTTNTITQKYYFVVEGTNHNDRILDIEPWMEENDDISELSVSLRNDSEEEEKANKNIYELNEVVTYYIDYKNGGKDVDDEVKIVLNLPLDYKVVDLDGGKVNSDDEIEWVFEDGLEEDESGTIVAKVKYTDLKRSKDDANTIYPSATIYKGSKVRDVSTVINMIVVENDEEIDVEHEPYMYGDADADTFRPDYMITRAEGALVLARIYGLDYTNIRESEITTKYTDINETYLEAKQAITAASKAGLINGYLEDDGTYTYRPNNMMTKAEFMKILACMIQEGAEDEGIDGLEIKELDKLVKIYDDAKKYYIVDGKRVYTHWAIEEITLLARLNMLPLTSDDPEFVLDEKITRAEVAQLINFYLLRAPAEVTSKTKTGFSDVSRKHELIGDIIEATRRTHTFEMTDDGTEIAR